MKDEVKPMEELERLFNERRRFLTNKESLEAEIKILESQLATKEESLIGTNENLSRIDEKIREMAGKL